MIAGIDEAGRGPLAGPVVAAAVILDPEQPISGLMDSKKLTERKREALYAEIIEKALAYSITEATVSEIDDINILQATLLAMRRTIEQLATKPSEVLIDGNQLPKDLPCKAQAIIQGDSKIAAISAASILAKVHRDRTMIALDMAFPQYGFAKHKGYGTKSHLSALREHGPCQHHRMTFKGVL